MTEEKLSIEVLRELPDGSAVLTYGVVWVKLRSDSWVCPTSPRLIKDDQWMSKVAVKVLHDVTEWEYQVGIRRRPAGSTATKGKK